MRHPAQWLEEIGPLLKVIVVIGCQLPNPGEYPHKNITDAGRGFVHWIISRLAGILEIRDLRLLSLRYVPKRFSKQALKAAVSNKCPADHSY